VGPPDPARAAGGAAAGAWQIEQTHRPRAQPARPHPALDFRTVETHRASIFSKLGVANSNGLLLFLGKHGLLEPA